MGPLTLLKLAYSIRELETETSIRRSTIYKHIKAGQLRITKVGKRSIVLREEAERWLAAL